VKDPAALFAAPTNLVPVQDNGALYTQAQINLATWSNGYPGACDPSDYGTQTGDFSGTNDPRTERALVSFQRWANARGAMLRSDGALDGVTFSLLQKVASDVAARHFALSPSSPSSPHQTSPGIPGWAIAAGLGVLAAKLFGLF
jgi:hypothetical protein